MYWWAASGNSIWYSLVRLVLLWHLAQVDGRFILNTGESPLFDGHDLMRFRGSPSIGRRRKPPWRGSCHECWWRNPCLPCRGNRCSWAAGTFLSCDHFLDAVVTVDAIQPRCAPIWQSRWWEKGPWHGLAIDGAFVRRIGVAVEAIGIIQLVGGEQQRRQQETSEDDEAASETTSNSIWLPCGNNRPKGCFRLAIACGLLGIFWLVGFIRE